METASQKNSNNLVDYALGRSGANEFKRQEKPFARQDSTGIFKKIVEFRDFLQNDRQPNLDYLLTRLATPSCKTSFLVFKHNKYFTVPVENIAFFSVKHESSVITCFDRQEYFVNHSLEQIQSLLAPRQFFRLNRQYLISFLAIKEVEHYFARKLLVMLSVATKEKLLVSKEKVTNFLQWLDNR